MASLQSAAAIESSESESSILCVQELIKDPEITVPQSYVRLDQEPPNLLNENHSTEIPTIDLESLESKVDADFQLKKLHAICQEWGIFQLVNHGVSSSLLQKLNHEIEKFYKLPTEDKMKYKIMPGDFEGYGTSLVRAKGKLDWGDRFYMVTNPLYKRKSHLLPELSSSFRNSLESCFLELQKLAMKLLGMMGKFLKMDLKEIEEIFEDGMQSVRMTYYPPCPQPELVMGITPHSDATAITILHQVNGVDGLQVKKDGVWIPVRILPNALVVNVGDILEIMSNGLYHSIEHRATVNSVKERIAIAFFYSPKLEAEVGPVTTLINPQNPPLFRRVGMEDYAEGIFSRKLHKRSYLEHMKIDNGEGNTVDAN